MKVESSEIAELGVAGPMAWEYWNVPIYMGV